MAENDNDTVDLQHALGNEQQVNRSLRYLCIKAADTLDALLADPECARARVGAENLAMILRASPLVR